MPTSPRERARDACPGVLRTHPAADGALARLRLPGGVLPARAARELAACARELADGHLELTSRGNVQLRGLSDGAGGTLAGRARAVGLLPSDTHERVRNIVASPLSGRVEGSRDIEPVVAALDRGICADPALVALPGRILFSVDDGSGDLATLPADLALRALPAGQVMLRVAGESRVLRVPEGAAVAALLAAARAFVELRQARGPAVAAWRIGELPAGRDRLLEAAARAAGGRVDTWAADAGAATDRGPAGAATVPAGGALAAVGPPGARAGACAQRDGRWALTVLVPLGRLRDDQLDLLAGIAGTDGAGRLVVTPWRSVVLRDLGAAEMRRAADRLGAAGLVVEPESGWAGVTSCAGRPGCGSALADVRRDAAQVAARPRGSGGPPATGRPPLPVHWSGCARRCGQPAGAVVEVIAESAGYRVRRAGVGGPVSAGAAAAIVTWAAHRQGELSGGTRATLLDVVAAARTVPATAARAGRGAADGQEAG
ncbi:nitrite reductase [Frankia sp. AgB32]|uniref:nitrite reductase n=1 Tax=Frankia sp. AgB32 TaxID=631119 RepID=UPI00200D394E|nr:nitrite reductase [Frankia sp. AgB32]MCK9894129.1 nitrite reductase [Frankia sp. AgB32]